jgi:hypothetical protein
MRPKLQITARTAFAGLFCIVGCFYFVGDTVTACYYQAVMPRLPQPMTGRIYRASWPKMAAVYVNEREIAWANFLRYDMMTVFGICIVLLAIFVIIPQVRRESRR